MLKKSITYFDYSEPPVQRTEDFYFNITVDEALELQVRWPGGIEAHIKRIEAAEDAQTAYLLFKEIICEAYGKRRPDGKGFDKRDRVTGELYKYEFEGSPALSELIVGFIQNPEQGGAFVASCLPPHIVAQAQKMEAAKKAADDKNQTRLPLEGLEAQPATAVEEAPVELRVVDEPVAEASEDIDIDALLSTMPEDEPVAPPMQEISRKQVDFLRQKLTPEQLEHHLSTRVIVD